MTAPLDGPEADVLGSIVESALDRFRRGERPTAEEYVARYPRHAEEIREAFSALMLMEAVGGESLDRTGVFPPGPKSVLDAPAEAHVPAIDRVLGDYRLVRLIGRGGMGAVYEAEQVSLKRRVALKILPSDVTNDPNRLARFGREARAAGRLHHTNIVPVFGFGNHEGSHFYIMPLIRGLNLDEVIVELRRVRASKSPIREVATVGASRSGSDSGPGPDASTLAASMARDRFECEAAAGDAGASPPPERATRDRASNASSAVSSLDGLGSRYWDSVARIGIQVAEALEHAHGQGILHRDIKPSNLLLDLRGTVWVTDFGLAKAAEDEGLSLSHDVLGTIRYMASERFDGRADARSDVYSLGLTLYELVALRPAFTAANQAALLRMVTHSEPASLPRIEPTVPGDLATIIHKAIAREPGRRYPSAAALAEDLRCLLERRPIHARRTSPTEKFRLWCRRNPGLAASNIAAAVLLTTLAIVATVAAWNFGAQNLRIRDELEKVRKTERVAKEQEFEALAAQARAGRYSRQSGQRFDSLEAVAKAARIRITPELRDEAIASLALPDLKFDRERPHGRDITSYAVSPHFDRYAFGYPNGDVVFLRSGDDREVARLKGPGTVRSIAYSPDGNRLRVAYQAPDGRGVLRVWDLRDKPHPTSIDIDAEYLPGYAPDLGFLPDGKHLFGGLPDGSIGTFNVTTGRLVRKTKLEMGEKYWSPSPDGRHLAYVPKNARDSVRIFDFEKKAEAASYPVGSVVGSIAWNDDGRLLAIGGAEGTIQVWDSERKTIVSMLEGHRHHVSSLAFTHASGLLVSSAWDGTTRLWDPVRGRLLVTVRSAGDGLRVSLDDRQVFHGLYGTGMCFLRLDTGRECRVLHHGLVGNRTRRPVLAGVASASFSPDGRWLASGGFDGVRVWDTSGGGGAHITLGQAFTAKFSPDGGRLLTFGRSGLWLWPFHPPDEGSTRDLNIGPPRRLDLAGGDENARASWSGEGRLLAASDPLRQQAVIFDAVKAAEVARLGRHPGLRFSVLSGDGRWAATSDWKGPGAKIWDVATGQLIKTLPCDSNLAFSPDGRWLAISDQKHAIRFWEVGTWLPGPVFERSGELFTFSHDGRLIVSVSGENDGVYLIDVATKRRLAALASPPEAPPGVSSISISPDGGQLALGTGDPAVLLWDLRLVRRQLSELGLDWDAPAIPERGPESLDPPASSLATVDYGLLRQDLTQFTEEAASLVERLTTRLREAPDDAEAYHQRGHGYFRLRRPAEAIADFDRALELRPGDAHLRSSRGNVHESLKHYGPAQADFEAAAPADPSLTPRLVRACNNLAWQLVAGPPADRDPPRAVALARTAVALAPDQAMYLNTLGVALYREGLIEEAIDVLGRSLAARQVETEAYDLFFQAMARHRLGQVAMARADFARAIRSLEANKGSTPAEVAELKAIRVEAGAVLAGPPGELPADVFAP